MLDDDQSDYGQLKANFELTKSTVEDAVEAVEKEAPIETFKLWIRKQGPSLSIPSSPESFLSAL